MLEIHPMLQFPLLLLCTYRALEASLMSSRRHAVRHNGATNQVMPEYEDEITLAMRLSQEEAWRQEEELRRECEMIEEAIRLSLQEK